MNLAECMHNGVGQHDCSERFEEAGVICSSKCTTLIRALSNIIIISKKTSQSKVVVRVRFDWLMVVLKEMDE